MTENGKHKPPPMKPTHDALFRALPAIVPLVFYHGSSTWNVPQVFGEIFDVAEEAQKLNGNF